MILNYEKYGDGEPLFILHGVFGMLDNWLSLGKKWAEEYSVYLIDARNHGRSQHNDVMTFEAMADDIKDLMDHLKLDKINFLGHSMGGKVAMKFAMKYPDMLDRLIVVDIGPKKYPMHHQQILKGLSALKLDKYSSRTDVDKDLSNWIPEAGVRQFLLKNLYWIEKGKLAMRMNFPVIAENMIGIIDGIGTDIVDTQTLFIRGLESDYIVNEDIQSIQMQFTEATIADVANAGHWVHAQAPKVLYGLVKDFLET